MRRDEEGLGIVWVIWKAIEMVMWVGVAVAMGILIGMGYLVLSVRAIVEVIRRIIGG